MYGYIRTRFIINFLQFLSGNITQNLHNNGQFKRLIGQHLNMFMFLREPRLMPTIIKKQPVDSLCNKNSLLEILNIEPTDLLFELLRDY